MQQLEKIENKHVSVERRPLGVTINVKAKYGDSTFATIMLTVDEAKSLYLALDSLFGEEMFGEPA